MNNYYSDIYNTKEVILFVDDMIVDFDITSYSDVSESDKRSLAGFLVEAEGKVKCTDWMEAFIDMPINTQICDFLNTSTDIDSYSLCDRISDALVKHYDKVMEKIVNDRIEYVNSTEEKSFNEDIINEEDCE